MPFYHRAYGLTIQSNWPIPGMVTVNRKAQVDLRIDLKESFQSAVMKLPTQHLYKSPKDQDGHFFRVWHLSDQIGYCFEYSLGMEFVVDPTGSHIQASWSRTVSFEDMAVSLLGRVMGFALGLRGLVCVHASAIAVGDRAIALLGPSGGGKSTTAAALARLGYPVMADDMVSVSNKDDAFLIQPGYQSLKLWADSEKALDHALDSLPHICPKNRIRSKRYLDLKRSGFSFQQQPLKLGAIYTGHFRNMSDNVHIQEIMGREAIITLLSNLYAFSLMNKHMRSHEFDMIHRIAARVPFRRITFRRDLQQVPRLCQAILNDFESLNSKGSAPCHQHR